MYQKEWAPECLINAIWCLQDINFTEKPINGKCCFKVCHEDKQRALLNNTSWTKNTEQKPGPDAHGYIWDFKEK